MCVIHSGYVQRVHSDTFSFHPLVEGSKISAVCLATVGSVAHCQLIVRDAVKHRALGPHRVLVLVFCGAPSTGVVHHAVHNTVIELEAVGG